MNIEMHEQKQAISLFSLCTGIYRPSARALILTKLTLSNSDWNQSTNYNSELIDWL